MKVELATMQHRAERGEEESAGALQTSEAVVERASQAASGDEVFVGVAVSAMTNALQGQLSSRKRAAPDSAQQAEARPAKFGDLTMTGVLRLADHARASSAPPCADPAAADAMPEAGAWSLKYVAAMRMKSVMFRWSNSAGLASACWAEPGAALFLELSCR